MLIVTFLILPPASHSSLPPLYLHFSVELLHAEALLRSHLYSLGVTFFKLIFRKEPGNDLPGSLYIAGDDPAFFFFLNQAVTGIS